ncbi:MAG TPA: LuxR C-terminal-related transcriptional regulator [Trebonia sp.]
MTVTEVLGRASARPGILGRDQDLGVIETFLDALPARGGALLLCGEPGAGQSALLDAADEAAAAAGLMVIRAAGAEFEEADFSGLNQLLLPLRGDFGRLDGLQRNALNAALGLSDGPVPGRLVVSNAALALLWQTAADRPLLLIVDNLHWMDQASTRVLGFIARRLPGSRIGLVAAQRTGAPGVITLDVPRHEVRPLDDDASAQLLATRFPGLAPAVRQRISAEARGNPLALLELPTALTQRQRVALAPLPAVLPLSDRLRALLFSRVSALPAATAYLLLLAGLDGTGDLGLLAAAAAGYCEIDDLAAAEQAGLVRVDETAQQLSFVHPLVRAAVLELSAPGELRQAHLALATHIRDQPQRRAWHLAEAATEPVRGVAVLRSPAPGHPRDRGHAGRARRLAAAAYLAANVIGDLEAAEILLASSRRACPDILESSTEAALATAFVLLHGDGDLAAAHRLLVRGMRCAGSEDAGPGSAEAVLATLASIGRLSGRAEHREAAPGQLEADIESLAYVGDPVEILRIADASVSADRLPDCRQALRRVARPGPSGDVGTPALQAGILLALAAYQTGQWDEARQLAESAAAVGASRGYHLLRRQAQTVLALVAAGRGDADTAQALGDEVARWAAPREITSLLTAVHYVCVLTDLARSDFETAYRRAVKISPAGGPPSREPFAAQVLLDLVESALRTGRRDAAVAYVGAVSRAGLAATSPRTKLLVTAALAMTAADDETRVLFDQALALEKAERWPFDWARVHLLAGERLRRLRELATARVHLGTALDEFRRLGASTWADRAAASLRATGQAPQRASRSGLQVLTPQELEIAQLAASGLSNKEIAGRLFISHRTVASHMLRIFPKLEITSRSALGRALPGSA